MNYAQRTKDLIKKTSNIVQECAKLIQINMGLIKEYHLVAIGSLDDPKIPYLCMSEMDDKTE